LFLVNRTQKHVSNNFVGLCRWYARCTPNVTVVMNFSSVH